MICTVHSIPIKPGKAAEAKSITLQAASYSKEHHSGVVDTQVLTNISGKQHRIHLVIYYASFAALEERRTKNDDDAQWQEIVDQARQVLDFPESEYNLYQVESTE